MPTPSKLLYTYEKTTVMAEWPPTHAKALEVVHRDFASLLNTADARIHFCFYLPSAPVKDKSTYSRISPAVWTEYFASVKVPEKGFYTIHVEVDPEPEKRKVGWVERFKMGLPAREKKEKVVAVAVEGKKEDSPPPAYPQTMTNDSFLNGPPRVSIGCL